MDPELLSWPINVDSLLNSISLVLASFAILGTRGCLPGYFRVLERGLLSDGSKVFLALV